MLITRFTKLAVVGVVATVVAGGAALAVTGGSDSGSKRRAADRANHAIDKAAGAVPGAEGSVEGSAGAEGAGSSTSADGSASGNGTQANASATGPGGATAGAGSKTAGGAGSIGGGVGGGGVGGGHLPGQTPTPPPGTGGGSPGAPGETFTPPGVPAVDLAPFKEGSHTVLVPGSPKSTKRLCLSGNVDQCKNIPVPAVKAVSMTVSYSANTSTSPPTFTVAPCTGGLAVTVDGISAGTNVTVRANGSQVSGTVQRDVSQSASLCDA